MLKVRISTLSNSCGIFQISDMFEENLKNNHVTLAIVRQFTWSKGDFGHFNSLKSTLIRREKIAGVCTTQQNH